MNHSSDLWNLTESIHTVRLYSLEIRKFINNAILDLIEGCLIKVTVQFGRCFRLMEPIYVISQRNPIDPYITEKLIKFSKSLFYFYLAISNK